MTQKLNKSVDDLNDVLKFQHGIPTGDDSGVAFNDGSIQNVIIGNYDNPTELCVGQGDSTTETMQAFHYNGSSYTDVTAEFASDSDSTTGLFGGTAVGDMLYIGGDFEFTGVKLKVITAGADTHNNYVLEYWTGSAWEQAHLMAVNSSFDPFSENNQRADNIATIDGISEQIYIDFDPYQLRDDWVANTINSVTKFWGRLRITSPITTDPLIQQVKLHTNRVEIENTGIFRYGVARYPVTMQSGLTNVIQNKFQDPKSQEVTYSADIKADYKENKFENNNIDGFIFVQNLDVGIDTSIAYELELAYYIDGVVTGDIEFHADVVLINQESVGGGTFVYDGTATSTPYSTIDSVLIPANKTRRTAKMYIDISHLTNKDTMVINIHRDATAGNTNDTLAGTVVMTHVVAQGYKWKD